MLSRAHNLLRSPANPVSLSRSSLCIRDSLALALCRCHHLPALGCEPVDFEDPIPHLYPYLVSRPAAVNLFRRRPVSCWRARSTAHSCERRAGTRQSKHRCRRTWVITGRPSRISYLRPRLIVDKESLSWAGRHPRPNPLLCVPAWACNPSQSKGGGQRAVKGICSWEEGGR